MSETRGHVAHAVTITPMEGHHLHGDGPTRYLVVGVTHSKARGREFQLARRRRDDGTWVIERYCHAPMWQTVVACKTSGERVEYHWQEEGGL